MHIYIINENEHLGPYEQEDLFSLYRSKKINDSTLIWLKKSNQKMTYKDYLSVLEKSINKTKLNQKRDQEKKHSEKLFELPPIPDLESARKLNFKPVASILFVLIILFSFYIWPSQGLEKPMGMTDRQFEEFFVFFEKVTDEPDFKVALNKNLSSIWILTKNFHESIHLKFVSVANRALSSQKISFKAQVKIQENKIHLIDSFVFENSTKLKEGIYKVNAITDSYVKAKNILLSLNSEEDFLARLSLFHRKRSINQKEFIEEMNQKYETLAFLADELAQKIIDRIIKNPAQLKSQYEEKYGPIFTSFIITNENDFKLILKKKYSDVEMVYNRYFELSNMAREFGSISYRGISNKIDLKQVASELEAYSEKLNISKD